MPPSSGVPESERSVENQAGTDPGQQPPVAAGQLVSCGGGRDGAVAGYRLTGDLDDAGSVGGRGLGEDVCRLVGREVIGVGVVAAGARRWRVGCVVGGGLEEQGGFLVAEGVEQTGEVTQRRPLLDPAAGALPVVDDVAVDTAASLP